MLQIQQNTGLSNSRMRKLGSVLNLLSPIRIVETNFQQKFAQAGQKLKDHFTVASIKLSKNNQMSQLNEVENNQMSQVVHCHDISKLGEVLIVARNF